MNIVLVLTTGEGGIPHYTAELANSLQERGNTVTVIKPQETTGDEFFNSDINLKNWFTNPNVSFANIAELKVSPSELYKACTSLRKLSELDQLDPDVVHFTHKPHSYLWPFIPTIDTNAPIIETRHNTENNNLLKIPGRDLPIREDPKIIAAMNFDSVLRNIFTGVQADGYIAHTESNTRDLLEKYPDCSVEKIPHGAFTIFAPDSDPRAGSSDTTSDNTLLFFGNITGSKGPDQLVRATVKASNEIDNIKTIIAGSGNIPRRTMNTIEDNRSLFEVINEFIPNKKVPELFDEADIVVIPHKEQRGHSGTMTIAFSHGKPVISTNVGEFNKLVLKTGAGYTVEPGDIEGMKDSICALLSDPVLRQTMGNNSREVAEELSWTQVAQKTEQFYRHC
ncbi:sugar transferase [Natrinema mahii]|nr:sugar transferase [Natrinema mahii]